MRRANMILIRVATLALATLLIATPSVAQQVDTKGEKELTETGQKIDKASASADSKHVTEKIVAQWTGTPFTFEKGGAPHELTPTDVESYRAKRLGYGEISILLALTAKQGGTSAASAKSVNEILAMRQTDKMGWGSIAKALGYPSLGSVHQSVKATEAGIEKVSGKAEKVGPVDKAGKPDKPDKVEKIDKPERIRVEKPERVEKPGR